jgi:single-strand DNA-binding protein
MEGVRLDAQRPNGADVGVEIGRTSPVTAPMPANMMLDLERALTVLGNDGDAHAVAARYMSLDCTKADVPSRARRRSHGAIVELEHICLMCSRPAVAGQPGRLRRALVCFGYPRIVVPDDGLEFVMLRIEIIGNLGSEPEQQFTAEGVSMASIRVAVNSRRKGPDGDQVERTDWFRVRAMGSKADYVQRFAKGQRVLVVGRLEIGEYTVKNTGEVRTSNDIWADDVVNLSPCEEGSRGQGELSTSSAASQRPAQPAGAVLGRAQGVEHLGDQELDELPF